MGERSLFIFSFKKVSMSRYAGLKPDEDALANTGDVGWSDLPDAAFEVFW